MLNYKYVAYHLFCYQSLKSFNIFGFLSQCDINFFPRWPTTLVGTATQFHHEKKSSDFPAIKWVIL